MGSLDSLVSSHHREGQPLLPPSSPLHCVGMFPSSVYLQSVHLSNSSSFLFFFNSSSYSSSLILNLRLLQMYNEKL